MKYIAPDRSPSKSPEQRAKANEQGARCRLDRRLTPNWCKPDDRKPLYLEAALKSDASKRLWVVDHIFPLGENHGVTGLNVAANLRVISARENCEKAGFLPGTMMSQLWEPTARNVYYDEWSKFRVKEAYQKAVQEVLLGRSAARVASRYPTVTLGKLRTRVAEAKYQQSQPLK